MYRYKAKVVRVVDADTLDAMVDLGFDIWVKKRIRLEGIDAYEIRTRDKIEKAKGYIARDRVIEVLKMSDNEIILTSFGKEKYGRCLGRVELAKSYIRSKKYHGKIINNMLLEEGHAKKYV